MAKKSKIAKQAARVRLVERHAERRAALKATIKDPATPVDARDAAVRALSRLPRD